MAVAPGLTQPERVRLPWSRSGSQPAVRTNAGGTDRSAARTGEAPGLLGLGPGGQVEVEGLGEVLLVSR